MLADIFRRFAPSYIRRFARRLLPSHARALNDILRCRTPACGGHLYVCADCGERHLVPHSCRNRHCPICGAADAEQWLEGRRAELLDTGYFHLVFTLPAEMREICRRNQKTAYNLLFQAANEAIRKLADDPRHLGARPAVLALLHTWTRALGYHPHVHCLATAGGVAPDGRWKHSNPAFLVPVRALSKLFRGIFLAKLAMALPDAAIPPSIRRRDWIVFCKPAPRGPGRILQYLGRYIQRVAIGNSRIVDSDASTVTFRYRDDERLSWHEMTLDGHEFLRRYLQHVLPRGFHKVRYYGLWHPSRREELRRVAAQLALADTRPRNAATPSAHAAAPSTHAAARPPLRCPRCGSLRLCSLGHRRPSRSPP